MRRRRQRRLIRRAQLSRGPKDWLSEERAKVGGQIMAARVRWEPLDRVAGRRGRAGFE